MTKRFQPASAPRLSQEEAMRQSRVTQLALKRFVDPPSVMAFLNGADEALGGTPLQVAVASPEGLLAVEQRLMMTLGR